MVRWIKRIAMFLGIVLVVLAAIPFFITLDDYIPRIEKLVSEKLKEPVRIQRLRFAALPVVHLQIDGIAIGKTHDLKIGKAKVTPDLLTLAQPVRVIKSIEISEVVLTQKGMDKIPAWAAKKAKSDGPVQPAVVRVESIVIDDATISLDKVTLGPFDARVSINAAGEPAHASLATRDGKLTALIKPDRANFLIDVTAKGWRLPAGPAIVFDELDVKGVATSTQMRLGNIHARLYGGSLVGKADIGWQKGIQVKGQAHVNNVQLRNLAPLFSPNARVSGRLAAKSVVFSTNAPKAAQLASALRLEAPFQVHDGVLNGVDIQKSATSLSKDVAAGGETRFEELAGHLALEQGTYRFTKLNIVTGSLGATGHVTISPAQELSGRINAELKAARFAAVPLNVSGTVQSPSLFPTAGYLAGAAAGTAVLGPVLGTAVGAKIGTWAESLFGSGDEKKPETK